MPLYAFGSNGNGQLSLGHADDTHIPTRCLGLEGLEIPLKRVVAGGNHTLVLCSDGRVFAAGDNSNGQCGISKKFGVQFLKFHEVPGKWRDIAAGWAFSVFVAEQGGVFICGNGSRGELGLGEQITDCAYGMEQVEIPNGGEVVSVFCGMAHTVMLLSNGEVWGWGAGRKGQLGEPRMNAVWAPRGIDIAFKAVDAALGREFTIIIGNNGKEHQILGGEKYNILSAAPTQGALEGYIKIAASWGSMYILYADGNIKAWGRNDRGQLPPSETMRLQGIAVGSEHALAVTTGQTENKLIAWGWGEHGNCGKSKDEEGGGDAIGETYEIPIAGTVKPGCLGAGCATSWAWVE